jgi:PAS domain S-box-containing protein
VRPFVTSKGRCVIVTHTDSTSVERATRAMRENDAFYRMILNAVPLYISYVNDQRELVHANRLADLAEEWLGHPIDVLRGRRLQDLMDAESYRLVEARVDSVLRGRQVDFESQLVRDTQTLDIAVSYVPHVVNGAVEGFFSVARDVTQEKRLESELLQSQKMEAMGRLTGGIAHDFNNLLSVIMGNLQLLERDLGDQTARQAQVRTALGAASRGADLTRRLLSFARPKARDAKPIDANALIDGLEELIVRTLGNSIELGLDLEPAVWPVRVDAGELENALLNLAINARDAMSDGGSLRVVTRNVRLSSADSAQAPSLSSGDYVEVSVRDTGCGMPAEVVKKAFEPFFTTQAPGKGTGLGLSIVYGFAIRCGGTALIESLPGSGTAVRLFFPRCGGAAATSAALVGVARDESRVLVVDNDVKRSQTTARLLRDASFHVDTAADLAQAIAAVSAAPAPDLVLLGATVCSATGSEDWCRRLRACNPQVRVLCPPAGSPSSPSPPDTAGAKGADLVRIVRSAIAEELAANV